MVRSVESTLLGLTGCKWYSVVLRNVDRLLLCLTGCICGGKGVKVRVFVVLCEDSKKCLGIIDFFDAHCYSEQIQYF